MDDCSWTRPGAEKWWDKVNIETGIEEYQEKAEVTSEAEAAQQSPESETCHCGRPVDGTPDLGPAPLALCSECLLTRCDAYPLDCPYRTGMSDIKIKFTHEGDLERAEEILRFVLCLRMYGESETETWEEADKMIEYFLRGVDR